MIARYPVVVDDVEDRSRFSEVAERAVDKPAFSNGSQWEIWSYYACARCVHEENCVLIDVVLLSGKTPAEWTDLGIGDYQCSEFGPVTPERDRSSSR